MSEKTRMLGSAEQRAFDVQEIRHRAPLKRRDGFSALGILLRKRIELVMTRAKEALEHTNSPEQTLRDEALADRLELGIAWPRPLLPDGDAEAFADALEAVLGDMAG